MATMMPSAACCASHESDEAQGEERETEMTTCFIERSSVRKVIIESCEINNEVTQILLEQIDSLPISIAADTGAGGRAMTDTDPLLPCPFCGSEAQIDSDNGLFVVLCTHYGCQAMPMARSSKTSAIESWNRRVALPPAAPSREAQSDLTRAELGATALRRQPARIGNESNHEYLVRLARSVINASSAVESVVLPFSKPVRLAKDLLTEFQAYWGEPPLDDQQFEMLEEMISEALASAPQPAAPRIHDATTGETFPTAELGSSEHDGRCVTPPAEDVAPVAPALDRDKIAAMVQSILERALSIDLGDEEIIGVGPASYQISDAFALYASAAPAEPDDDWEERGAADELREATIEECAKVADRTALRCIREKIHGDASARFIAAAIRGLTLVDAGKVGEEK
jgi:Restriction alleviation protein Lar